MNARPRPCLPHVAPQDNLESSLSLNCHTVSRYGHRSVVQYDEPHELVCYVWNHYQPLMTEFERRVGFAIMGRMKADASNDAIMKRMLRQRWGGIGDAGIDAALEDGAEVFRQKVAHRVMSEQSSEMFINRCPCCGRVVRTPKAQQCFWCGFDWHGHGG